MNPFSLSMQFEGQDPRNVATDPTLEGAFVLGEAWLRNGASRTWVTQLGYNADGFVTRKSWEGSLDRQVDIVTWKSYRPQVGIL